MNTMRNGFPEGFYWGGAIAANQAEARIWRAGCPPRRISRRGGSLAVCAGMRITTPRTGLLIFPPPLQRGFGAVWRDRFNIFRTSINWTRIFPTGEEDVPNEEGAAIL